MHFSITKKIQYLKFLLLKDLFYGHEPPSAGPVSTYSAMISTQWYIFKWSNKTKNYNILANCNYSILFNLLDLFKQFSDFMTHSLGKILVLPSSFVAHIWVVHSELQLKLHPFVSCSASLKYIVANVIAENRQSVV